MRSYRRRVGGDRNVYITLGFSPEEWQALLAVAAKFKCRETDAVRKLILYAAGVVKKQES